MATLPNSEQRQVGLLVLESDPGSSAALKQILDSEGWRVRIVEDLKMLHVELKTAEYSLLIANIALIGLDSPTFHVLKELGGVSAEDGGKIRTLFVIPELNGTAALRAKAVPFARLPGKSERSAGGSEGDCRAAADDAVRVRGGAEEEEAG
jgi:PleD family two-component response regulator